MAEQLTLFGPAEGGGRCLTLHVDGASRANPGHAAVGIAIYEGLLPPAAGQGGAGDDGTARPVREVAEYLGIASNNAAEYRAMVRALELAAEMGAARLRIYSDSELLVRQLSGEYRVKSPDLMPFYQEVRARLGRFREVSVRHVPRELNRSADALANRALDEAVPRAGGARAEAPDASPQDN